MLSISIELAKQEKIEDSNYVIKKAQEFALDISNETDKVRMLKEVSRELIKRGKIGEALESLNGINVYKERYDAVNKALLVVIGIALVNDGPNIKIYLEQFGKLKSLDVKKMYLRNWVENIQIKAVNMAIVKKIILLASEEFRVIENILQYFIINQLFFNNIDNKKINQFEQRLNIKWALDLKYKLQ